MIHYINNLKYLVDFELFYGSIDNLKIFSGDSLDYIKTKTKDLALTSSLNYSANIPHYLSNEEFERLKNPSANWNSIIQKADKGNQIVLVEKDVYIGHIEILITLQNLEKWKSRKEFWIFQLTMKDVLTIIWKADGSSSFSVFIFSKNTTP